jgi:hypothetical protein
MPKTCVRITKCFKSGIKNSQLVTLDFLRSAYLRPEKKVEREKTTEKNEKTLATS